MLNPYSTSLNITALDAQGGCKPSIHVSLESVCGVHASFVILNDDASAIERLKSSLDSGYRAIQNWEERERVRIATLGMACECSPNAGVSKRCPVHTRICPECREEMGYLDLDSLGKYAMCHICAEEGLYASSDTV